MSRPTSPRPANAQRATVWTIGNSNRTLEEFVSVLAARAIEAVVDVRRFPGSRRHPHFGFEALDGELSSRGIAYGWVAELGGRRRIAPGPLQAGWRNPAFASYAAYLATDEFAAGLAQLLHVVHRAAHGHHVLRSALVALPPRTHLGRAVPAGPPGAAHHRYRPPGPASVHEPCPHR